MFVDTHCHISKKYYDDIDVIMKECLQNKVSTIIISCCEKDEIEESLEILSKYDYVYATFGFHPDQIDKVQKKDLDLLEQLIINNKKIIGIGEIGLDYHYPTDKEKQKQLFEQQLLLAEKYQLPVVIHSRDATKDTIDILKQHKVKGVIHCFSGSIETANIYINMGYKLGIGGVITFKNSKLEKVVEKLSLSDIVLETDSPFLAPSPFRGTQNSPKNIPIIVEKIATLHNVSILDVAEKTTQNCTEIFDLKK